MSQSVGCSVCKVLSTWGGAGVGKFPPKTSDNYITTKLCLQWNSCHECGLRKENGCGKQKITLTPTLYLCTLYVCTYHFIQEASCTCICSICVTKLRGTILDRHSHVN